MIRDALITTRAIISRSLVSALIGFALIGGGGSSALAQARIGAVVSRAGGPDLETLLALQRRVCPSAAISASFYDWRDVSKYRSTAGLHLGYDVAMPAGAAVVAGWPGQVTRIQQWYGAEYGITVLSPSGYEVTYGHLSPRVKVGDVMNAGDVVGLVVNDHVDVKMRGPDGAWFDFGHGTPPALGAFSMPLALCTTLVDAMRAYETLWQGAQVDGQELGSARRRERQAALELDQARKRVLRLRSEYPRLQRFLDEGLVARADVDRARTELRGEAARVEHLQREAHDARRDIDALTARAQAVRSQLAQAQSLLERFGVRRAELERRLRTAAPSQAADAVRASQPDRRQGAEMAAASASSRASARAEAERMEQLFEQGVVSRVERDRARERYESLRSAR